jgi:hypothetical protein
LYTLPELARHAACVSPILGTVLPLANTSGLRPISYRLLSAVWCRQSRIFPRLQSAVATYNSSSLDDETRIALASIIRDVCQTDAEKGLDLVATLNELIMRDANGVVVALGLDALSALCKSDALEFRTAWNVIAPKVQNDARALVIARVAEFFRCGATADDKLDVIAETEEPVRLFIY